MGFFGPSRSVLKAQLAPRISSCVLLLLSIIKPEVFTTGRFVGAIVGVWFAGLSVLLVHLEMSTVCFSSPAAPMAVENCGFCLWPNQKKQNIEVSGNEAVSLCNVTAWV